jgi:uncharacterized protein YjbJ (UPF0337 family)
MNWDQIKGNWKQAKGEVKSRWGKLTDDDLDVAGGEKDKLVGRIQERYGIAKEEASRQVDEWHRVQREENAVDQGRPIDRKAS